MLTGMRVVAYAVAVCILAGFLEILAFARRGLRSVAEDMGVIVEVAGEAEPKEMEIVLWPVFRVDEMLGSGIASTSTGVETLVLSKTELWAAVGVDLLESIEEPAVVSSVGSSMLMDEDGVPNGCVNA